MVEMVLLENGDKTDNAKIFHQVENIVHDYLKIRLFEKAVFATQSKLDILKTIYTYQRSEPDVIILIELELAGHKGDILLSASIVDNSNKKEKHTISTISVSYNNIAYEKLSIDLVYDSLNFVDRVIQSYNKYGYYSK